MPLHNIQVPGGPDVIKNFHINGIDCTGNELQLRYCITAYTTTDNTRYAEVVGVSCYITPGK